MSKFQFNGSFGLDPEKFPATHGPIHSDWIEPKESRVQIDVKRRDRVEGIGD
jgi:hypothetical protein